MSRKIQFHTFHLLFRLFSYLADKSGGWSMFVRPKLVIGALIVGLGFVACEVKIEKNTNDASNKSRQDPSKEYQVQNDPEDTTTTTCYVIVGHYDEKDESNEPFIIVEKMPEFQGGNEAMMHFIDQNLRYPSLAKKDNAEGMVICAFVIDTDGSISDINIVRGIHPLLDTEAVRLINKMPKWIPGKQGGKTVPVKFTLPIRFTLPDKKL